MSTAVWERLETAAAEYAKQPRQRPRPRLGYEERGRLLAQLDALLGVLVTGCDDAGDFERYEEVAARLGIDLEDDLSA